MPRLDGCTNYPVWVVQKVCDIIFAVSDKHERVNVLINLRLPTRRGRPAATNQDTMTKAFDVLAQSPWEREEEASVAQHLTRKRFNYIAIKHYCRFLYAGKIKPRQRTTSVRELSRAQRENAARILGSPVHRDGYLRFHKSAMDAAAASYEFRRLAGISKLPLDMFGVYLCEACPDIVRRAKVDACEEMYAATLDARRAAHLGGRAAWRRTSQAGPRGGSLDAEGQRAVYWRYGTGSSRWPYYNTITFKLDAAKMSSGDNMKEPHNRKAFQRSDVRYATEVLLGHEPVGSQVWAMFYVVVHPEFGLVSGPDFMY